MAALEFYFNTVAYRLLATNKDIIALREPQSSVAY